MDAEQIRELTGLPIVAVEKFDEKRRVMKRCALCGLQDVPAEVPASDSLSGTVARTGRSLLSIRDEKSERRLGARTFACVPITEGHRVKGTLTVASPERVELHQNFLSSLEQLAGAVRRLVDAQ